MSTPRGTPDDRFRLLVESVIDYGIFSLDVDGRVTSWNTGAQQLKGYTAEEIIGQHFSVFYLPEVAASGWPAEELRRARDLGRFEDEGFRVRKDGTRFWANVVITALYDPNGELTGYAKVTRDLTERRNHEEALRISEERFRLLVDGVRDYAIFMLDPSGAIISWNKAAQEIKGYTAAEVLGRPFSIFYTPEDLSAGKPKEELETALAVGRVEEAGWRVRKDGSVFWANVVISPIFDAAGVHRGFAKVTRDLTDRRRLEELEASGKQMSEFLAMLAHELRNPLAPIRNAVTIMQLEPVLSPVIRTSRDVIDRQLSHLTRLVDDLLDVGRMTSGKVFLRKERLLYGQVIARAVEAVRPLMDTRRHHLSVDLPLTEIYVEGDGVRLTQVLQNLLINAAKYTPDGGHVDLSVRLENGRLVTTVRDDGVGLTGEASQQIFGLFSQGDGQTAAKESGLGIGLTLARALVEMHGGTLTCASEGPGRGSTFTFFIPGAQIALLDDDDGSPELVRCLVIDDNRDSVETMAQVLRLMGCAVQIACDGRSGLALAEEYAPAVVFLDLGMPGMNGYEVVAQLRASPRGATLLIAAVTGYSNAEDRERTKAAGFDIHLSKPVDLVSLRKFLERATPESGMRKSSPMA